MSVTLVETDDEKMLAETVRRLLDDKAPIGRLRKMRDDGHSHDPDLWALMANAGWAGVLIPEEHGGVAMGHGAAVVLAREMGRTLAVSPFISTAVIAATALMRTASQECQDRLCEIAGGKLTYALALDETAKHAPEMTTMQATRDGNGFRLNGVKGFVPDGLHSDRLLVLARTSGEAGMTEGLSLFDLSAETTGITRDALPMIDSRDAARISFDDVGVTGDQVLGRVDCGMYILRPALEAGQSALAAEMTGAASAAFGMTVGYLKDRKQFGTHIGTFQALQHRAAHLWSEIEITASALLNAQRMLDSDPDNATLAVSLAKARATGTFTLAVQEAVQMHGGIGMTDEFDVGFYMKRARVSAEWLGDYGYHAARVAELRGM